MVEVMRRRFVVEGLGARAEVMDGQALGLDDASFDLGTSTFGLLFFPGPSAGLRELRRVLRPGGSVGIASWDTTRIGLAQLIGAAPWLVPFLICLHLHRRRGRACARQQGWGRRCGWRALPTSPCTR